jgi:hypothetical protein
MLVVVATMFFLGTVSFMAGVLILALRAASSDVKTLAVQTTRLAHKGVTEDIAGLVGNASNLLEAMNKLVRTTAGIGVFLTLLGLFMMGAGCYLAIRIFLMQL